MATTMAIVKIKPETGGRRMSHTTSAISRTSTRKPGRRHALPSWNCCIPLYPLYHYDITAGRKPPVRDVGVGGVVHCANRYSAGAVGSISCRGRAAAPGWLPCQASADRSDAACAMPPRGSPTRSGHAYRHRSRRGPPDIAAMWRIMCRTLERIRAGDCRGWSGIETTQQPQDWAAESSGMVRVRPPVRSRAPPRRGPSGNRRRGSGRTPAAPA